MHRVLLADDEAHVTHVVERRLIGAGYDVRVARDGEEAWLIAQEWHPQVVVTDLQMPYMNGLELARLVRTLPETKDIPIVMLTARGYGVTDEERAEAGLSELLAKPFSVRKLVDLIASMLVGDVGKTADKNNAPPERAA